MPVVTWCIVIGSGLIGAVCDLRWRRIPNLLTFPVFFTGLLWNGWTGGWTAAGWALLGALVATLPYLILYLTGCGGAGDAKMMAALGAWLGWPLSLWLLFAVALVGAMLGLGLTGWRGKGGATLQRLGRMAARMVAWLPGTGLLRDWAGAWPSASQMTHMPYGIAIWVGSLLAAAGVWLWH